MKILNVYLNMKAFLIENSVKFRCQTFKQVLLRKQNLDNFN